MKDRKKKALSRRSSPQCYENLTPLLSYPSAYFRPSSDGTHDHGSYHKAYLNDKQKREMENKITSADIIENLPSLQHIVLILCLTDEEEVTTRGEVLAQSTQLISSAHQQTPASKPRLQSCISS